MPLDSHSQQFLQMSAASGGPPLEAMAPSEARAMSAGLRALYGEAPAMMQVRDETIRTPAAENVARVFVPGARPAGVLVYFHGGGWVFGGVDDYDTLARKIAARTGCAVVLPSYRLAPEHRHPAALEDAWAALEWTAEHAGEIAGAKVPLVVAGDSAGGNLATLTTMRARDRGGPDIALQVLVYPVTDADFETESYREHAEGSLMTRAAMRWLWDHYVPDPTLRTDPEVSPLRASSLRGLPPAVVVTAEYDPLRSEGEAYAARLVAAGVPVTFRRYADQMHGFFQMTNVLPGSDRALEFIARAIGHRLDELQSE